MPVKKVAASFQEAQSQLHPAIEAVGKAAPGKDWEDAVLDLLDAIRTASQWVEHGSRTPEREALLKELLETEQFVEGLNLPNLWETNLLRQRREESDPLFKFWRVK